MQDTHELPRSARTDTGFDKYGLPVRRQGQRPTCSAFAFAGALDYALAISGSSLYPVSIEYLCWAARKVNGTSADGAYFSDLIAGFLTYGVCAESDMPYAQEFSAERRPTAECRARARSTTGAQIEVVLIKEWDVECGLSQQQLAAIKRTIACGYPVCVGMRWPKSPRWDGGKLVFSDSDEVFDGHSVVLCGFEEAAGGEGFFSIRDSGKDGPVKALPYTYVGTYTNDALWMRHRESPPCSPAWSETGSYEE